MTSSNPSQGTPDASPDAAIGEPQDHTPRPPKFAIEIWASPQLREHDPRRRLSLREALDAGHGPASRKEPEPDREPEAEP